jgi:hypothetical protein
VFAAFASFEKRLQGGDDTGAHADNIVVLRRRNDYEEMIAKTPRDYDAWLDLCRLEESLGKENAEVRRWFFFGFNLVGSL